MLLMNAAYAVHYWISVIQSNANVINYLTPKRRDILNIIAKTSGDTVSSELEILIPYGVRHV